MRGQVRARLDGSTAKPHVNPSCLTVLVSAGCTCHGLLGRQWLLPVLIVSFFAAIIIITGTGPAIQLVTTLLVRVGMSLAMVPARPASGTLILWDSCKGTRQCIPSVAAPLQQSIVWPRL
jgi:hypothetical protein